MIPERQPGRGLKMDTFYMNDAGLPISNAPHAGAAKTFVQPGSAAA
jgi:hypothetical protein